MIAQPKSCRRPTSSPALLVCKNGKRIAGIVKNLSEGGAKIDVGVDAELPDEFHLEIEEFRIDADVRLIWRIGPSAGVQFLVKLAMPNTRRTPRAPPTSPQLISLGRLTTMGARSESTT